MAKTTTAPAKKTKQSVPFEKAISMTGYGKFNYILLLVTGGCLMCVIIETTCMMFIVPAAQCDLDLNLTERGLLSSISFFGVVSGSHMWGYFADTRGRRKVLITNLVTSSITTCICSFIPWDWLFILLRFINGFFIGGASSVVYAYLSEFHDNYHRPKVISWMSMFVAIGNMFLPSFAWLILPQSWSFDINFLDIAFRPWRMLLIIYAIPSLLIALCLYHLPESPKYLLTQGRTKEAYEILKTMFIKNSGLTEDDFLVKDVIWEDLDDHHTSAKKNLSMLKSMWRQTKPIFKGDLLSKTLMICFLQLAIFASNSGIVMWYPEILNRMSLYSADYPDRDFSACTAILHENNHDSSDELFGKICKDSVNTDVFLVTIVIGVAYALVYLFVGAVINMCGKKTLLMSFLTITAISGIASQFVDNYYLIQFLIGFFLMDGVTIGITTAIAVDLFPTQVRGMALAVSMMCGRIGAMVGTNIVGPIIYHACSYLFLIVAADHIVTVLVVWFLPSSPRLAKIIE